MSVLGGPRPSSFYVERSSGTRSPATPATPSQKDSRFAYGQNDPGLGQTNPGDGLELGGVFSVTVSLYANPGQTLSGTGTIPAWLYNPYQAAWTRYVDADLDPSIISGSPNAFTFAPMRNPARNGYFILWVPTTLGLSAGDVLLRIDGFVSYGGQGAS